nr:hypothetical protein [Tanacetum cinerariifolium]
KFRLAEGKFASTLIDAEKPLLKDSDGDALPITTNGIQLTMSNPQERVVSPSGYGSGVIVKSVDSSMAFAVICLSTGRKFNFSKNIFDSLDKRLRKEEIKKSMLKKLLLVMQLKEMMLKNHLYHLLLHLLHHHNHIKISHPHPRVKKLEKGNRIRLLKLRRLKRVGTSQRIDTFDDIVMGDESNQGGTIDEMDKDDDVALMDDEEEDKKDEKAKVAENEQVQGRQAESQAEIYKIDLGHALKVLSMQEDEPAELQEVVDVVTTGKLITEVVTAASETVIAASATISAAEPQVPVATITAAPTRVVAAPSRRRKGVKSDAAEGFEHIINFLSGSYIHYALTVNPPIYISYDVTRLQALVDRKKIVISEDVIREILQLDDAEGVSLSAKRTSWNEFSTAMASAVICLSKVGDLSTHTTRYIFPTLTQKIFANMRRVRKGFSGVETPLFEGMLAARQLTEEGIAEEQVQADVAVTAAVQDNVVEDVANAIIPSPPSHDIPSPSQEQSSPPQQPQKHDKATQKLEIIKLKARVKRLERANKVKSSKLRCLRKVEASRRIESSDDMEDVFNQGRMIDDLDKDEGIELAEIYHLDLDHPSKVLSMREDDSEVQEVVEVVTTAKLITNVVTAASQDSAANATIFAAKPSIPAVAPTVVDKGKGILIETPNSMKKKDQIELDAEYARKLHEEINKDHEEINKDIDWNAAIYHVNKKSKNPQYIKRYQGMKKRPQTERMSYDEICPIFQARFDENMRFLFKSREEIEEEDQETMFKKPDGHDAVWKSQRSVHGLALVKS